MSDPMLSHFQEAYRVDGPPAPPSQPPRGGRAAPACIRRAEEYIDAHAAGPVELADIVAAAGVPERTLRAAFAACRGMPPMAFLRRRRIELALPHRAM